MPQQETQRLNLAREKDWEKFYKLQETAQETGLCAWLENNYSLHLWITTDKALLTLGNRPVLVEDSDWVVVDRGLMFYGGDCWNSPENWKDDAYPPVAVVLPNYNFAGHKHVLLTNGDENLGMSNINIKGMPTASFTCITRLATKNYDTADAQEITETMRRFTTGTLRVEDFTEDESRRLTKAERKLVDDGKYLQLKPPVGFTRQYHHWHRSGTVLIYDTRRDCSYLVGQDEGTYFGVELPDNPKSVAAAYKSLTPKGAQNVVGVQRQGEWFVVPVDDDKIPDFKDRTFQFTEGVLPLDHAESNEHSVACAEGFVTKDGTIYARNMSLTHNQHAQVGLTGWCKFLQNTARAAVSVEGVD